VYGRGGQIATIVWSCHQKDGGGCCAVDLRFGASGCGFAFEKAVREGWSECGRPDREAGLRRWGYTPITVVTEWLTRLETARAVGGPEGRARHVKVVK